MEFRKYQHIERFGSSEVEGIIDAGYSYVFPKIDGTNASVWVDNDGNIAAGSRNRALTLEKDRAGFFAFVSQNEAIKAYLEKHPSHRLFGEWLVPHSLKTYRDDAWRKFYIFDVSVDTDKNESGNEYLPYNTYKEFLDEFDLDYITPLRIYKFPQYEDLLKCLDENTFLVKDGEGTGEGIVIKNYDFYNKYHRQTWAKIITSEFKEKHHKEMGAPLTIGTTVIEDKIVAEYVTTAFIEKEFEKIVNIEGEWNSKMIPRLLNTVYHELLVEETYNMVKKFKQPTINYKRLNGLVTRKIKQVKPEIFD